MIFPANHPTAATIARMAIEPSDPAQPLAMAKADKYDSEAGAFVRGGVLRWLRPGRRWVACSTPERTFSALTYERLKLGEQVMGSVTFRVGDDLFVLLDDGFTAEAVEA